MRAGLHAGEIERRGEDVGGIAVHVAARVAATAVAGEVLVSNTVVDLVEGAGVTFADRGAHTLKGVPDPRKLWAVTGA
jgi:class 3 adenylate cyclase